MAIRLSSMRTAQVVSDFLDRVTAWATHQPTIAGVALVGSYARGEARPNSDLSRILMGWKSATTCLIRTIVDRAS
jgi:predicted nucleotidyltransferase